MDPGAVKLAIVRRLANSFPRLWMERELHFRRNHFEREFQLVPVFCDKEKISIDVGANVGLYSYYMKKFSRKVIAFEPNTDLWGESRRLLGKDFHLEAAALSGKSSKVTMRVDPSETGNSTIEEKNKLSCVRDKEAILYREVETRTLDSFHFQDVSLIKIDVEGHEESVVEGAVETIQRNRPVLIIESEDRHNPGAPLRLAEAFSKRDYLVLYVREHCLLEFSTLREEDTDPENLSKSGGTYVNNFIFIPVERSKLKDRAEAILAAL